MELGKSEHEFLQNDASASRIRTFDTWHAIACSFISTEEVTIEQLFARAEPSQHLNDSQHEDIEMQKLISNILYSLSGCLKLHISAEYLSIEEKKTCQN